MLNPLLGSGALLGWGLGANDSANVFGTAVATNVIRYRTAIILTSVFVFLGAIIDGNKGIEQIASYAFHSGIVTDWAAFYVMLAAGLTVATMTILKYPVSTSQAVIGAVIGFALKMGRADFSATTKFFGAWFLTPIGGILFAYIIHLIFVTRFEEKMTNFKFYENFIVIGYVVAGIFGSYALGANNVANVMGVFAGLHLVTSTQAAFLGGVSIVLGVLTFSKAVMSTLGEKIVPLSPTSGLVVVLASSLTVYIYARIGIPVSSSQAVVGAVIGIGLRRGVNSIDFRVIRNIFIAWFATPTVAGFISFVFALL